MLCIYIRLSCILIYDPFVLGNSSVWLTVSFTIERYIAVCHPMKGRVLCTENRAKMIILVMVILCIIAAASTSFEHQLAIKENCMQWCNETELNNKANKNRSSNNYGNASVSCLRILS